MKLDARVMERRSMQRRSLNRGSMNRESPNRGSFQRTSLRTSKRRDDREPLNTRESAVFTDVGLANPGFEDGYRKPVARAEPIMQNGQAPTQNGRYHNWYNQHSADNMEIIGLDDSPKMYDKRRHFEDLADPQIILELDESPKMGEKWRHADNQNAKSMNQSAVTMEAQLRYYQLKEQHKLEDQNRQINAQHRENLRQFQLNQNQVTAQLQSTGHQVGTQLQHNGQQVGTQLQHNGHQVVTQLQHNGHQVGTQLQHNGHQVGTQLQHNGHQVGTQLYSNGHQVRTHLQSNGHQIGTQLQSNNHMVETQLQSNGDAQDEIDGHAEQTVPKKRKKSRRNLPKRIRDSEDSKWSMGYTRETVIQLKRNPSSISNSPTASKDFDPENPPGILKYRDSELSDYDSVLGDSLDAYEDFDDVDRPRSGFFDKLTRRSPSPKQTLAVAPYRQSGVENHQHVPVDQFLTLDPKHLKAHVATYSPSKLSPSQLSPTGREGRYSYFSPEEDFDHSFAKSYPEFVQSKANQPKDVLPQLHINSQSGWQTSSEISNGVVSSPKQYVKYNRAGEELRCTSL
ncbi:uncharacterized protein LOC117125484 isoform X2 [Anneissia japonica]|nr:uncharacterized protein LOC117125484 isoform X2 [Anneissia japonica]